MSGRLRLLITGGSSGLGQALALSALKSHHFVIATARNTDTAAKRNQEFEKLGGKWLEIDVKQADCQAKIKKCVEENDINVLVNNAGYALLGPFEDMSDAEIQDQMNTNFYGPLRCIKGALPYFRTKQHGTVINVSSGAAFLGLPARGIYAASKAALETMSEALAAEVANFNIRVIIVVLGAFSTNFASAAVEPSGGVSKHYLDTPAHQILEMTKQMGLPENQAKLGDVNKAAERILEMVTKSGMAADEKLGNCARLILGKDCLDRGKLKSAQFNENLDLMEEIAASTLMG